MSKQHDRHKEPYRAIGMPSYKQAQMLLYKQTYMLLYIQAEMPLYAFCFGLVWFERVRTIKP